MAFTGIHIAKVDSANKCILNLCLHKHGDHICLKKGPLVISHQFEGKQFNQGQWKIYKMKGYTSRGVGVSGMPVRFKRAVEVVLITLEVE